MIYLIEDEPAITEAVTVHLDRHGFEVRSFQTASAAEAALLEQPADLLIVDVHLPDGDEAGFELVGRLRAAEMMLAVIMLTARDAVEDRVLGLNVGADDYLPKPFALSELLARVQALLRRSSHVKQNHLERGPLELDFTSRRLTWNGVAVALTPREYDLLELFARDPEHIFSTETIIDRVWRESVDSSNVVRVYVYYLRSKLGPEVIEKVSGGYRLGI